MNVIILCAGYGTRLYPLTKNTPKALLKIGKVTLIELILKEVASIDNVEKVFIVTNHKFLKQFNVWMKDYKSHLKLEIFDDGTSSEKEKLGAIRDLELVIKKKKINDDILVIAGDNLFDFDLISFVNSGKIHLDGCLIGIYDIKDKDLAKEYGTVVGLTEDYKIINFEEKPENPKSVLISVGIYFFSFRTLSFISEYINSGLSVDAPGFFIEWLVKKREVRGYKFKGRWLDIGTDKSYKEALNEFL